MSLMVLGRKLLWYTCEAVQIDVKSPRAADLVVVVTFWRSPVIHHTLPIMLNVALHPVKFSSEEIIYDFCASV